MSTPTSQPPDSPVDAEDGEITLGVSITVPEPYAAELTHWRVRVGDPLANLVEPHITLIPPTAIPVAQLPDVLDRLRWHAARHHDFTLHLRGTGTFRPISDVVFVTVSQGISACEILADDLRFGPLEVPLQFPYHPHVTVAHNVAEGYLDEAYEGLENFRANLVVDQVAVHRQNDNGSWDRIATYPLAKGSLRNATSAR